MKRSPFLPAALCALAFALWSTGTVAQGPWQQHLVSGPAPSARLFGATTVLDRATDRMILFGGRDGTGLPTRPWVLTNATGTGTKSWIELNAPGPQLANHMAVYDPGSNRMIVFGGCTGACLPASNTVYVLTNANGLGGTPQWLVLSPVPGGPTPGPMHSGFAAYDQATNQLIVFGGHNGGGQIDGTTTFDDTWLLTNANGLGGQPDWILVANSGPRPLGRYSPSGAFDHQTNRLVITGGIRSDAGISNGVWTLDGVTTGSGTWTNTLAQNLPGNPPPFQNVHGAYYGSLLFLPIPNAATGTHDLWMLHDGSSWTQLSPVIGPATTFYSMGAVYNEASNVVLALMANGAAALNQLWSIAPEANRPPAFAAPTPAEGSTLVVRVGRQLVQDVIASDLDAADTVTILLNTVPPGLITTSNGAANPATLSLDWTPTNANIGSHTLTFAAEDNHGINVLRTFTINVLPNAEPAFQPPTPFVPINAAMWTPVNFMVAASDGDPDESFSVEVDLSSLPPGAQSFSNGAGNPATRSFTWTPGAGDAGPHDVRFHVTDRAGVRVDHVVQINVAPNTAPVFVPPTPFAPINGKEGRPIAFEVTASDADTNDGFTVDVNQATLPPGAQSFGGNFGNPASRTFQWTPGPGQAGTHAVQFSVTDRAGVQVTHDVHIIVAPNSAPIFVPPSPFAPVNGQAGRVVTFSVQASDADADETPSVTVDFSTVPAGANVAGGGTSRVFTWIPGLTQTGLFVVKFSASDLTGASTDHLVTINIAPNNPPIFVPPTPFLPFNVQAGTAVNFTLTASDADPDESFTVDVDVSTLPAGANSGGSPGNPASRTFSWTPGPLQIGSFNVRFSATDLAGARTEHIVTINVAPNNPPFFVPPTPFGPLTVNAGSPLQFTLRAQDADGHHTQIGAHFGSIPSGVNVGTSAPNNPVEITVTWTPTAAQAGTHTLNFFARDQFFAETPHSVTITVAPVTLVSIAVTPQTASTHTGQRSFTATGTFSDGSTRTLQSGSGGQGSSPLWQTFFSPGMDVTPCDAATSFSSQAFSVQGNQVHQVWSPLTPVLKVDGTISPSSLSFTLACTNGSTTGTLTATWDGTRYTGTYALGASTGQVTITGWSTKTPMPAPRFNFGAAAAENGKVYAIGGVSGTDVLDRVESYDPATNTWTSGLAPMPTRRSGLGVAAIGPVIYAVGGSMPGDVNTGVLEAYDTRTNTWDVSLPAMPTPRGNVMVAVADGKLYVIGGDNGPNNSNPLNTVEVFDGTTWETLPPAPSPRHFGVAGVVGNTLIVVGGNTGAAGAAPTEKFDLGVTPGAWSTGVALPGGRIGGAGGAVGDGLVVFGGQTGAGLQDNTLIYYLGTPQRPEGWATLGAMPTPRAELAAAVVGDVVYGIGGFAGGGSPQPGLPTLTALSTPLPGHLQTGFGGTSGDPQVQWSSSNPGVATINAFGSAQAVAPGETTIIAAAGTITCASTNSCATLTVTNAPPTVQITGGPFTRNEGQDVFINANSFDPDNDPLTRQWSIVSGPGQFVGSTTGFSATFRNTDGPGQTTIRLTVTDPFGASASSTTTVQINNVAPQVQIFGGDPLMAIEGQAMTVNGNFTDPGADLWEATVDYGDGTGVQPLLLDAAKTFQLSHAYALTGMYFVTVTVRDDDFGAGSQTRAVMVNPSITPPPFSLTPATPADACVCTPAVNLAGPSAQHQWFVKANDSGQLTVTLVASAVNPSGQTVFARVWDGDTMVAQLAASYPAGSAEDAEFRVSQTIPAEPGRLYRVQTASPGFPFARYWLRFDGAVVAGLNSPTFSNIYGGSATWLLNVDGNDGLSMRLFTKGIAEFQGAMPRTIAYQWIAPNGDSEPIQTFEVVVPASPQFLDTAIPGPANVVPGIWRLRLSTDFDYRLEKQSGADRGLYLDHRSGGRASMTVRLVDHNGAPLTEPVNVRVSFGKSFDLVVENGLLHLPLVDAFVYHFEVTAPDGLLASPATFDLTVLCDQPAEMTVVLAPPEPPTLSVALSPDSLWPANNAMVDVTATIAASSPYGTPLTIELISLTGNDADAAGDIANAAIGTDDRAFQLRAARTGGGVDRIYTAVYRATDTGTGLSVTGSATATVPHDQRRAPGPPSP